MNSSPASQSKLDIPKLVASYKDPKLWTGILTRDEIDPYEKVAWLQQNWTISIYASIIYVVIIFGLREWMKGRKAFDLKIPLILWNFTLAILSIKCSVVTILAMVDILKTHGFHSSACGTVDLVTPNVYYWGFLFVLSKIVELGDTIFIVLRKRPLIFLHWYHHISVLTMAWIAGKDMMSPAAWGVVLNSTVHGFMYTYFTLTAMQVKIPKRIAMSITAIQLTQFVIGLVIHGYAFGQKWAGNECIVTNLYVYWTFGIGVSYLFLFGKFFYDSYLSGRGKKRA